jgi:predicted RNA binding protein YcfA (HicA-like mRNA interferase family)
MKLPRDCSGADLIKVLCSDFGYAQINQEGSHVMLQTDTPRSHRLSVPNHPVLRPGTLNAILRAVAQVKGIEKGDVLERL